MNILRTALIPILLLCSAIDASACRCEERPLSDYFNNAEFVAIGELVSAEAAGDDRRLGFRLRTSPHKGKAGDDDSRITIVTAASTATCGVQPDVGAIYVLFAYADAENPKQLRVDTCSGTRVHISTSLDEPVGFVDVPARFVAGQLNALMGMEVLRNVSANAPQSDSANNDALVGLLDLKALAHGGSTRLYKAPNRTSPVMADVDRWDQLEHREVGYEVNAAVVYQTIPGWYRLRLADGAHVWAEAEHAGTWFDYADLPVRRLAYLTESWPGLLWPNAGAGLPTRYSVHGDLQKREYAVNVLESTVIGGMPFFRVEYLESSPCEASEPAIRGVGWVPAYDAEGEPAVWYYSRGC